MSAPDADGLLDVVSMNWAAGSLYWEQQIDSVTWSQYVISTAVYGIIAITLGDVGKDVGVTRNGGVALCCTQ